MESKYGKFIGTTLKIPENKFAKPNSFKWKTSNAKTFFLDKLGKWMKSEEVQAGFRQGKILKLGCKESFDDRNPRDEKGFLEITFYLGVPSVPRSVDGFKKVQVPPVQVQPTPQPQAIQTSQVVVKEKEESFDDEIPF